MSKFRPTYVFRKVEDITVDFLNKNQIKGILLDVDNTLMNYTKKICPAVDTWIKKVKNSGIKICILSNAVSVRKVRNIMARYDINGLANARKPRQKGYQMAMNLIDLKKENIVMIGDQIFTDVVGANKFGIKSIYVKPISPREWIGTWVKRPFERLAMKIMYKGEEKV